MKILYTASATATGGRAGRIENNDGSLKLGLAIPKEMGGKASAEGTTPEVNTATNPEELFAGGYAACFGSALEHVARQKRIITGEVVIRAKVSIGPNDNGGFSLAVELDATLPAVDQVTADELITATHQVCPYSNATRGNIDVKLTAHGGA